MTLRKWILLSVVFSMLVGCEPYSSGDRVLVNKNCYDNGVTEPRRYQVVVFKYPKDPVDKNTPKNYIKRLLGLPGELIAIFFGRLYHMPAPQEGSAPYYDDLKDGRVKDPNKLWEENHRDDKQAGDWFDEGKFTMLRKPPHIMLAMRRIAYDNDFQAKDLKGKLDRWNPNPQGSWKPDQATGFINDGTTIDRVAWLRYEHLLRPDGPFAGGRKIDKMLILDTLDYNTAQSAGERTDSFFDGIYGSGHWVGDLMLECNLEVVEPKGEFWFELSKGIDRFRARFDLSTGQCTLFRVGKDAEPVEMASQPTRVKSRGNYLLRFANIDARLAVWVDRDLPFGDGKEYAPPEVRGKNEQGLTEADLLKRRGPTQENDLEPASIGSKGAAVKVTHLRLWRDTYYRTKVGSRNGRADVDYHVDMRRQDWSDPSRWEDLKKLHVSTMYVQPGHYLCLGDNSQASSDSRDWGLVPQRLMLGRALVVYFPLDRIGPIR